LRIGGRRGARPPHAARGGAAVLLAVLGRGAGLAGRRRGRCRAPRGDDALLARLAPGGPGPPPPGQRAGLGIRPLTYLPPGAPVAALVTSLRETPGGERNWDYRYTWMRD